MSLVWIDWLLHSRGLDEELCSKMQNTNISVSVAAHINELDGSNQVMQTAGMFC